MRRKNTLIDKIRTSEYRKRYRSELAAKKKERHKTIRENCYRFVASHSTEHDGTIKCAVPGCDVTDISDLQLDHIDGNSNSSRMRVAKDGSLHHINTRTICLQVLRSGDANPYRLLCTRHNCGRLYTGKRFNNKAAIPQNSYHQPLIPGLNIDNPDSNVIIEQKELAFGISKLDLNAHINSDPYCEQLEFDFNH